MSMDTVAIWVLCRLYTSNQTCECETHLPRVVLDAASKLPPGVRHQIQASEWTAVCSSMTSWNVPLYTLVFAPTKR